MDFWTYSCINCQRSLPHLEAWNRSYAADGLTVIGVHTPEFAFEHVVSNVTQAAKQLGVRYPIAIDNDYSTWNAYENQYWPAEYLIDATGHVRHVDFGEGHYGQTETFIRHLLVPANPKVALPRRHRRRRPHPDRADHPGVLPRVPASAEPGRPDHPGGPDVHLPGPLVDPPRRVRLRRSLVDRQRERHRRSGATLPLNFEAKDVYLVLGDRVPSVVSVEGRSEPGPSRWPGSPGSTSWSARAPPPTGAVRAWPSPRGAGLRLHLRLIDQECPRRDNWHKR